MIDQVAIVAIARAAVCLAAIKRATLRAGWQRRGLKHEVQVIVDHHYIAATKLRIHAASGIGNDQLLRA